MHYSIHQISGYSGKETIDFDLLGKLIGKFKIVERCLRAVIIDSDKDWKTLRKETEGEFTIGVVGVASDSIEDLQKNYDNILMRYDKLRLICLDLLKYERDTKITEWLALSGNTDQANTLNNFYLSIEKCTS